MPLPQSNISAEKRKGRPTNRLLIEMGMTYPTFTHLHRPIKSDKPEKDQQYKSNISTEVSSNSPKKTRLHLRRLHRKERTSKEILSLNENIITKGYRLFLFQHPPLSTQTHRLISSKEILSLNENIITKGYRPFLFQRLLFLRKLIASIPSESKKGPPKPEAPF